MKGFLIIFVIVETLLSLSSAQLCNPMCTREMDPHCGVTAKCLVRAANPCTLRYKACIIDQYHLSPIIDVLPGPCPRLRPICHGI